MSSWFTLSDIKSLQKDLSKFVVDQGRSLNKDETDYVQLLRKVILYGSEGVDDTEASEFTWPVIPQGVQIVPRWLEGWKERHKAKEKEKEKAPSATTSGQGAKVQETGDQSSQHTNIRKRTQPTDAEDPPAPKRLRSLNNAILDFHIAHLINSLKDKPELANRIVILQEAIRIVNAGAKPRLLEWHVEDIKNALPDEEEIRESVDLLIECIKFRDVC